MSHIEGKDKLKALVVGQVRWLIAIVRHKNRSKLDLSEDEQLECLTSLDNVLRMLIKEES